mgnify:CR=1 FL=1
MPDITGPIVNFATDTVGTYGVLAVFILMILESACIPVPSEAIMVFGGFLAGQGKVSFWAVVVAGVSVRQRTPAVATSSATATGIMSSSFLAQAIGVMPRPTGLRRAWMSTTASRPRRR